ncbi:MAG: toxin TcdB middle/C-terminal domain-containing protein, partial [Anaerolineales bacterium]
AYHHGYFDGVEREFRGFGMVEQWDTEAFAALSASDHFPTGDNIDAASHVPPVYTKTWFHTGAFFDREHIYNFFAGLLDENDPGEYYREPGQDDAQTGALLLADTVLPDGLSAEEAREACRALKGAMLRQEVYAEDNSDKAQAPYTVTEQNFTIQCLQPQAGNRHAAFFTHPREAISYHYERNPADPRITHALTLEVDDFGNVLRSLSIGYGRRQSPLPEQRDRDKQTTTLITSTESSFTNAINDPAKNPDDYRAPLPAEVRTYELTGFEPGNNAKRFSFDEWAKDDFALLESALEIAYQESADLTRKQKRLIEHVRTLYRKDDLTGLLALGNVDSRALPGESYKLAFTPALAQQIFVASGKLPAANVDAVMAEGGYVHSQGNAHWWIPSGRLYFDPNADVANPANTAAAELAEAGGHFFLPRKFADPFQNSTTLEYDGYDLSMAKTQDALGNTVTAQHDYRVLQPTLVIDPNGNHSEAAFDALGLLAGTALMGKLAPVEGDSLAGFEADLTQAQIDGFYNAADPHVPAVDLLKDATTRIIYDLGRFQKSRQTHPADPTQWLPVYAATLARETHVSDPPPQQGLKIQVSFSYSDGFGREIQKKVQAEPGPLVEGGAPVDPRWAGSGWTIFNNKGKPVRQYEPFFDDTHAFKFGMKIGVSPILFYDPLERIVATLHPNNTYEKVVFDPWQQSTYDVNDTVAASGTQTGDPRTDPDVAGYVGAYFASQPAAWQTWYAQRIGNPPGDPERDAAQKAAAHADTPMVAHFDALGRAFLTIADNGPAGKYETRVELDIENNQRSVTDALGRIVMTYDYDMLGAKVHQASMDAGERWMLNDVTGKPIRAWDSRQHEFSHQYDALRRPTEAHVRGGDGPAPLNNVCEQIVYGEGQSLGGKTDHELNLRGKIFAHYDTAGKVQFEAYDFKGNPLVSARQLLQDYKQTVDWAKIPAPVLETETFTSHTTYDALNRPLTATSPDGSVYRPTFNEANLLDKVDVNLRGAALATAFVTNIDYDAKGQRTLIAYGNGVSTTYEYDPLTFRLIHLLTARNAVSFPDDCPQPPPPGWPGCQVQNLRYTYDPTGNITAIRDDAQQTVYFRNHRVEPSAEYTYDAIYRLTEASGREHLGQTGGQRNPPRQADHDDSFHMNQPLPNSDEVMGRYSETYNYDPVGNFLEMIHAGSDPANPGWTRHYLYEPDPANPLVPKSNRLTQTTPPGPNEGNHTDYTYDAHGNMTTMPHLPLMRWDYRDQLQATAQQVVNNGVPETTWYVYDAAGQRARKITEHALTAADVADGKKPERMKERIYLGGFEIFRDYENDGLTKKLERETLHIMDDKQRIALVETQTVKDSSFILHPSSFTRYQFGNHLGSAGLELDDQAQPISYEEYYPYGSTSYQAVNQNIQAAAKRYRYTGKERDEESGLYYHGARYYAPWLGRWLAIDPLGMDSSTCAEQPESTPLRTNRDGQRINGLAGRRQRQRKESREFDKRVAQSLYMGMGNNPLILIDPDGKDVYVLFYTQGNSRGDSLFKAAADTREADIKNKPGFDSAKDKVFKIDLRDLADIKRQMDDIRTKHSATYGKTTEVGIYSHAGTVDGPVGTANATSDPVKGDEKQITLEGWGKIDFNWKENNAKLMLYGCSTGDEPDPVAVSKLQVTKPAVAERISSFARKLSKLQNIKGVPVWGQAGSSRPSKYVDYRVTSLGRTLFSFFIGKVYMIGADNSQALESQEALNNLSLYDLYPEAKPMNIFQNGKYAGSLHQEGTQLVK